MSKIEFMRYELPVDANLVADHITIGGKIYPEDGLYADFRIPVPLGAKFLSVVESNVYGTWDLETEDPRKEWGIWMPPSPDSEQLPVQEGFINIRYRFFLFPSNGGAAEGNLTIAILTD
jgi:hypothetical protein